MPEQSSEKNSESRITQVLYKQISLIVGVVAFTISIFVGLTTVSQDNGLKIALIQKDVDVILNNHLSHLRIEIDEIKEDIRGNSATLNQLTIDVEKLITLVEAHMEGMNNR